MILLLNYLEKLLFLEKFNLKKNFVTYIDVFIRKMSIEITQGPPGETQDPP